jgi:hypothetical protein
VQRKENHRLRKDKRNTDRPKDLREKKKYTYRNKGTASNRIPHTGNTDPYDEHESPRKRIM